MVFEAVNWSFKFASLRSTYCHVYLHAIYLSFAKELQTIIAHLFHSDETGEGMNQEHPCISPINGLAVKLQDLLNGCMNKY